MSTLALGRYAGSTLGAQQRKIHSSLAPLYLMMTTMSGLFLSLSSHNSSLLDQHCTQSFQTCAVLSPAFSADCRIERRSLASLQQMGEKVATAGDEMGAT